MQDEKMGIQDEKLDLQAEIKGQLLPDKCDFRSYNLVIIGDWVAVMVE